MSYYKSKHFFNKVENFERNNFIKNNQVKLNNIDTKNKLINVSKKKDISPDVWGSGFWLVLHLGSANYPEKASSITQNRMKYFILGLPYILPCNNCFEHALDYIEKNKSNLDNICKGRESLFKFFNDFHNEVNIRLNKPYYSLEKAKKKYF